MIFDKYYLSLKNIFNNFLFDFMTKEKQNISNFHEIMMYSIKNGGKRIRPFITMMIFDSLLEKKSFYPKDILFIASSIELIHTYSLIHDDLPAMDNDDLRRGQPTVHIKYSQAHAILAGDSLLTLAFQMLSKIENIDIHTYKKLLHILSHSSGHQGMIGGQVLDIENENKNLTLSELENIHRLKTGKLISTAISMPLIYYYKNNIDTAIYKAYKIYGESIGLAFQIIDDILDVTQTTKTLGKNAHSDIENNKTTYTSIMNVKKAKKHALEVIEKGKDSLKTIENKVDTKNLNSLADFILQRLH